MRILVTGGCGFIGRHLVDALIAQGRAVRVLDDLSTGKRELLNTAAEFIEGSVADPATVEYAVQEVEGIVHLAAIASVERCNQNWAASHLVNAGGSVVVFEAAARKGTPVVYASSAAVYGDNDALPLREDAMLKPSSPYGADKAATEMHAAAGARVNGLTSVGLRFFNVYGPGQDPASPYSGVITKFAARIAEGLPLIIHGDGSQTRDFVFVRDVVNVISAALDQTMLRTDVAMGILNVGTGNQTSIKSLAENMLSVSGTNFGVEIQKTRSGDITRSVADTRKLKNAIGFVPNTLLKCGLRSILTQLNLR